jgi:hypothetical protein
LRIIWCCVGNLQFGELVRETQFSKHQHQTSLQCCSVRSSHKLLQTSLQCCSVRSLTSFYKLHYSVVQ